MEISALDVTKRHLFSEPVSEPNSSLASAESRHFVHALTDPSACGFLGSSGPTLIVVLVVVLVLVGLVVVIVLMVVGLVPLPALVVLAWRRKIPGDRF